MNLDIAGEFLVMAATLIHIKSRMLLPRPPTEAELDREEEDPREALVRRLIEHQRFKVAAELLHERETWRSAQWPRSDAAVADVAGEDVEPELEVDLFSLLAAFRGVLERASQRPRVLLPPEQISIESRIEVLLTRLSETEACGFEDLFGDVSGARRPHRDVSRAARDDPAEAGAHLPVGALRPDSRIQARTARRRAAPDHGS